MNCLIIEYRRLTRLTRFLLIIIIDGARLLTYACRLAGIVLRLSGITFENIETSICADEIDATGSLL